MVLSHLAQIYGGKPNANIYIGDNTNNEYGVDGVYEQNFAGYKKDDHEQDKNFSEHTLPSGRLYMLQAYNTNVANGGFGG